MTRVSEISELQVVARLAESRIIALAQFEDAEQATTASATLVRAGIMCVELTAPTVGQLRAARGVDGLVVGAGEVLTVAQAEIAARGGAHFATAPATNMEVIHACRELELPFFPGVATPSEIDRLAQLGVRTLRVFPAEALGGAGFIRAVSAVYPDLRFIPSGGIGPESLRGYLALPSVLAVGGSGLIRSDLLRSRSFDRIEWLARDALRSHRSR